MGLYWEKFKKMIILTGDISDRSFYTKKIICSNQAIKKLRIKIKTFKISKQYQVDSALIISKKKK